MAGAKFYYNLSDNIGQLAAKIASNASQYATPKANGTFTIHNYYSDADANYEYITPRTSNDYGGWASHNYYAIAEDKFYYYNNNTSSSNAYESFKFVHRLSAPLLKKQTRTQALTNCQAPFSYLYLTFDPDTSFKTKIYWDNSNNRIKIDTLNLNGTVKSTSSEQGYGVFILLSGGGGGGGGGDNEYWGQGKPGGGGGGGGGTALMYFDAKKAYDLYPGSYLSLYIGTGGAGGKGGNGFTAGTAGGDSLAELKNSSGTTLREIRCGGGGGGAGHPWDAAADSAGGAGGKVFDSYDHNDHTIDPTGETRSKILRLLDSVSGGKGGAGKRGADGISGNSIINGNWSIPFKDSWGKLDTFSDGSTTCYMGRGSAHNWQGGGGGGCGTGYKSSSSLEFPNGHGMGGYGGGSNQAGLKGDDGICCIFHNYIPGVSANCAAKKV